MDKVITVDKISKKYNLSHQRGTYVAARDVMAKVLKNPLHLAQRTTNEDFWALKDVSFDVFKGEALGIIGANGSGKSTLLKVMTKITPPTHGQIRMQGRVVSLLEVGTGFHPELTGRENVFLNGAILGMTKAEITAKFDEIVKFSGVEKFIDTPVKHFSSGMYVRLAFAVAAHLEPDILIVDEVLAVGDAAFQKKCMGKMDEVTKTAGRTVLFVSHNMSAIQSLCTKCLYLDKGEVKAFGETKKVIDLYLKSSLEKGVSLEDRHDRKSRGDIKLTSFHIENNGKKAAFLESGSDYNFCFSYTSPGKKPLKDVSFWCAFYDEDGSILFQLDTNFTGQNFQILPPNGTVCCKVKHFPLASGIYQFSTVVKSGDSVDLIKNAGAIEVRSGNFFKTGPIEERGQFFIDHEWSFKK